MLTRRTQKYDKNPALKGKQSNLPDELQKKIITARLKHAIEKKAGVHTLITGHSGAGKSTLARSFDLPIHALDDDPAIREQINSQMEYARANGGRLPLSSEYADKMRAAERSAIERALALEDPHVIEGSYLLNRDPNELKGHALHLVDTPEDVVLDRRVERQRVKDLARGRHWDDERAAGVRMRGQQLIDEYRPGVAKWRASEHVKKAELAHKRTDDGVRVGRKLYRPKVQTFMYDDQGRILAAKSQGAGSGLRAYNNYKFPGGGVEAGENISEAARKELLEEAGYEPAGDMFEFGTPTPVDWDKRFRAQARKKGRGRYAGQYEYYAAGPLGKRNTSLFGAEGDQMSDLEMVPLSQLQKDLTRTANDPGNEYGYFDKQKLVALEALKRELESRGVKTAARRTFRPRVEVYAYDKDGNILVGDTKDHSVPGIPASASYMLPGGGIERGQDIFSAAKQELLEEAGTDVAGDMFEFHSRKRIPWLKLERELNARKGRHFDGLKMHYVAAPAGKHDTRILGSEGDALRGISFIPIRDIIKSKKDAIARGDGGAHYDAAQIRALTSLKRELEQRGIKTASVATKRDPEKWARAKADAKARMGGKHSARAMQLATKLYKQRGGSYAGKKPAPSQNKLRKWTKQDWQWSGGDTPGQGGKGVYLPKRSASALKSTEQGRAKLESASRVKSQATARGQQFSSHGLHVGKKRGDVT